MYMLSHPWVVALVVRIPNQSVLRIYDRVFLKCIQDSPELPLGGNGSPRLHQIRFSLPEIFVTFVFHIFSDLTRYGKYDMGIALEAG